MFVALAVVAFRFFLLRRTRYAVEKGVLTVMGAIFTAITATWMTFLAVSFVLPTSSTPGSAPTDEATAELMAQERVADLARNIGTERPSDINGWARAVLAQTNDDNVDIELIGIDARQSTDLSKPFGTLDFRIPEPSLQVMASGATGPDCFRVQFDYYGKVGTWETSDGVDPIDCPPSAAIVRPPIDDSIFPVVSENAREVTAVVLRERAQTGSPTTVDEIIATISAQLQVPTGEFEVAAPPRVIVQASSAGDRVGIAFGSADDCVLVKSENGTISDVYPPPITLQPGELGCTPETALTDPDQLRSPH